MSVKECAKTYQHWYPKIRNSLELSYSNRPIKWFNNKIKVLKIISFGIRIFKHLFSFIFDVNIKLHKNAEA